MGRGAAAGGKGRTFGWELMWGGVSPLKRRGKSSGTDFSLD